MIDKYGGTSLPRILCMACLADAVGGTYLALGASLSKTGGIGRGVVFLAWGSWAAKRVAKLSKTKHLILKSAVGAMMFLLSTILILTSGASYGLGSP